jgi:methylated-DNA-[protein]-cysteine S-methyltransferase
MKIRVAAFDSPIGKLALAVGPEGLLRLDLRGDQEEVEAGLRRRFGTLELRTESDPDGAVTCVQRYFSGELRALDEIRVDPGGTPFQHAVWLELRQIRAGETWSYARLAQAVGRPSAVRAVGAANGANTVPLVLPCHRVIGHNGRLVGYGGGLERKEWLLRHERARFVADVPPAQLTLATN